VGKLDKLREIEDEWIEKSGDVEDEIVAILITDNARIEVKNKPTFRAADCVWRDVSKRFEEENPSDE